MEHISAESPGQEWREKFYPEEGPRKAELIEGNPYNIPDHLIDNAFLKVLYEKANLLSQSEMNPKLYLDEARRLLPEKWCAKDVHAASVTKTPLGEILMYTRNGMANATPKHKSEYRARKLVEIAQAIPSSDERKALVDYLKSLHPDQVTNCLDIAKYSGTPICLKGFTYDNPTMRAKRSSDAYCPNSRAGCSERNLLYWLPYALDLQNTLGKTDRITVADVRFDFQDKEPLVKYQVENEGEWRFKRIKEVIDPLDVRGLDQTLIVSMTPCTVCTPQIIAFGIKKVIIERYSKYPVYENYCFVDQDDLSSLKLMNENGIAISHVPGARKPVMRQE